MLPEYFESVNPLKLICRRYLDGLIRHISTDAEERWGLSCLSFVTRRAKSDLFSDGGIDDRFRRRCLILRYDRCPKKLGNWFDLRWLYVSLSGGRDESPLLHLRRGTVYSMDYSMNHELFPFYQDLSNIIFVF